MLYFMTETLDESFLIYNFWILRQYFVFLKCQRDYIYTSARDKVYK